MENPKVLSFENDEDIECKIQNFIFNSKEQYILINSDISDIIKKIPDNSINMCITSPPYWKKRKYNGESTLGLEKNVEDYVYNLTSIFSEIKRVLKKNGSFWLNIGDSYKNKNLCGIPWKVVFSLQNDGWILRNSIIWDKIKGNPSNSKDKLRNVYENLFHFVKNKKYYYNLDSIREQKYESYYKNGKIVTATGVSGIKYKKQIEKSKFLNDEEKKLALKKLNATLKKVENGELPDFRMVIRGQQRTTHSNDTDFSGRANELNANGFYILPYHPKGSAPGDIWRILPEDKWRKDTHFAVFPKELCEKPILASCPEEGIVLDPFVGTGSTIVSSLELNRRSIGVDISEPYLDITYTRIKEIYGDKNLLGEEQ